ncbi:MAG: hypothetical protein QXM99_07040, partial [Thermofilum sp.]
LWSILAVSRSHSASLNHLKASPLTVATERTAAGYLNTVSAMQRRGSGKRRKAERMREILEQLAVNESTQAAAPAVFDCDASDT